MYQLPDLPYDYSALGKYISADIMRLHHSKHHQAYTDKFNAALEANPLYKTMSLPQVLADKGAPVELLNNGGGYYNHALFWQWMAPNASGEPGGKLALGIEQKYGSFQAFTDEFNAKALGVFGSGWAWLQPDLSIITTANQDTPMLNGLPEPVLGLDVWEHAYYLDYKNVRADYVKAWWNVVNWDFVAERYGERSQ